jgi:polar amino acid transport system permease protein
VDTSEQTEQRTGRPEDIKAVPVRHPGRWIAAVIIAVLAASIIRSIVSGAGSKAPNTGFQWHVVGSYLFDSRILHGVLTTLFMTVLAMVVGIVLGVLLAVMRQSPNPLVSGSSWLYIWFFRGTPLLVQLIFWFNIASLFPVISLGVPFGGPAIIHGSANTIVTTFVAALLGLGLNEGAYMAEIVRAGFLSVPHGQTEAAQSLGMSRIQIMRLIVLPQAMRVIVPPTGNETISMLKTTSLVVVIGYFELMTSVQRIYSVNFQTIPLLIVAAIWYLALTSVLSVGQGFVERRYGRGVHR